MLARRSRLFFAVSLLVVAGSLQATASCSGDDTSTASDAASDGTSSDGTGADGAAGDAGSGDDGSGDSGKSDASTSDAHDAGPDGYPIVCDDAGPCVVDLSAGTSSTCAIMSDRTVRCWGTNGVGESGQPLPTDGGYGSNVLAPLAVSGLTSIHSVTVGAEHGCALSESGNVQCWGTNQYAQLAEPADGGAVLTGASAAPVAITLPANVAQVSAGFFHTCARWDDGSVRCWGYNSTNQIGNVLPDGGSLGTFVSTPTLASMDGVRELDVGGRFACGLLGDGGVSCWGHNAQGQLGRGGPPFTPSFTPFSAPVVGLTGNVAHMGRATGYSEAVVLDDKTARIWGADPNGELANDGGDNGTPAAIAGLSGVVEVAVSYGTGCALKDDGTVVCWGTTESGASGVGPDAGTRTEPHVVSGITDAVHVVVGWELYACALRRNGSVVCWGDNEFGQLGRGVDKTTLPYDPSPAGVAF